MIKLRLPLKHIYINQGFGLNFVDFYRKLGLNGHNGTDFKAKDGCYCYASHAGKVLRSETDGGGGKVIELLDEAGHYKTVYYHLKDIIVEKGDYMQAGAIIATCDNTGIYTTGDHLHFGLKLMDDKNFNTLNYNNGFKGAVNPATYFKYTYNGQEISPKDWDKPRAYHRYNRGRPKGGYWIEKYRVVPALTLKLGRLPSNIEINACTYGGWDWGSVINPAMYHIISQMKKDEFLKGEKPYS